MGHIPGLRPPEKRLIADAGHYLGRRPRTKQLIPIMRCTLFVHAYEYGR